MGIVKRKAILQELVWLAQGMAAVIAILLASWLRFDHPLILPDTDRLFAVVAVSLWLLLTKLAEDQRQLNRPFSQQLIRMAKLWLLYLFINLLVLVGFKIDISRIFLGIYMGGLLLTSSLSTYLTIWYYRDRTSIEKTRILIVGSDGLARYALNHLEQAGEKEMEIVGIIGSETTPGVRWLGDLDHLNRVLQQEVIDEILIAMPWQEYEQWQAVLDRGQEEGKAVHLLATFGETRLTRGQAAQLADLPVVTYSSVKFNVWQRIAKRAFDIAFSTLVLIGLLPLFLVIALLIKLDSPGPVFFVQPRVGLNGRIFKMIKFRTMVPDAEARLKEVAHLNEMNGPVFKVTNDPRITRFGRFLRKTSLDELPQFINVLLGDMSVVGPRPALPLEVAQYDSRYRRRLSVKPGITCIWQVSGRNDVSFEEWMEMDMEYIDRASLWLDLMLVVKTVFKMAEGK